MKKIPYGISDYERLVESDYYYVDKTEYIEKLEKLPEPYLMFLRPRKFGKTLFTSILENYYDKLKADEFESLYGETYIGKNPTHLKNKYSILKFNFSGINTENEESTMKGFREKVLTSIESFVNRYEMNFYLNPEQTTEGMLNSLFEAFRLQKNGEKIYVILDEYDHFTNELLTFNTDKFQELVSQNGKVRKWYEILKEGTESVVDRIFITGVAPITLDSLTSGFNIIRDITMDVEFNEMLGFTKDEIIKIMETNEITKEEQNNLLPIMKENYDGYKFSKHATKKIYNSNMCLFLLSYYIRLHMLPDELIDVNIASDYSKLANMLSLCEGSNNADIIDKSIAGDDIVSSIVERFSIKLGFGEKELVSMLFYLGYLTIVGETFGKPVLKIPNKVMKDLYSEYFVNVLSKKAEFKIEESEYNQILEEIALNGKIDKLLELTHIYLRNLSNRDFQRFDEKYVKLIIYCITMNLNIYRVKSEFEMQRKYPDLLLIPREGDKGYKSVMIELKYLKKEEANKKEEKMREAIEQIIEYKNIDDAKDIKDLSCYAVVVVNDEIFVEKV